MPRLVLDTNVFISAYGFGGKPWALLQACATGIAELVTSPAILAETAHVMERHGVSSDRVEEIVKELVRIAEIVEPDVRLTVVADDPDNRVLEAALAAGADAVVSGDAHLLELGVWEQIRVLTVADALGELEEGQA